MQMVNISLCLQTSCSKYAVSMYLKPQNISILDCQMHDKLSFLTYGCIKNFSRLKILNLNVMALITKFSMTMTDHTIVPNRSNTY